MNRTMTEASSRRAQALQRGREAFQTQAWGNAFSNLLIADGESPLEPADLTLLAQAAQLIGKDAECADLWARAHQGFLSHNNIPAAARCAIWLGFTSLINGEHAKAGGWLSRGSRLLDDQPDCVEKGYVLLPQAYRVLHEGDADRALTLLTQAVSVGKSFGDKDLVALGLQGQGRALIRQGEIARGVALLDEAMVAVTAGDVSPLNAGGVYCSVLDACGEIFDLRRAQEWTSELEKWCAAQPDLVPYRGHCLVRRAELLHMCGAWPDALEWAQRAVEFLSRPTPKPGVGDAFYQLGEIHRLRGQFDESEDAYRHASEWNRISGPGLAQLRLCQGRIDAAHAAIRRVAEETQGPGRRSRVLDAYVEIALAAGDSAAARAAAVELREIATRLDIAFLRALALRASASVLLAEDKAQEALAELRESWRIWRELRIPYEASRVRYLIATACRNMGEGEDAMQELAAARLAFQSLGATVDLRRMEETLSEMAPLRTKGAGHLTAREVEVLRLVAAGMTNRGIAGRLKISEKTVARHLSNIFTKLDLPSRTAATAYAYDHKLV
jgi:DNA-binding CsgD family transcriptional regulator